MGLDPTRVTKLLASCRTLSADRVTAAQGTGGRSGPSCTCRRGRRRLQRGLATRAPTPRSQKPDGAGEPSPWGVLATHPLPPSPDREEGRSPPRSLNPTLLSLPPPGLSNIIGIIVYISANAGDPGQRDSKKSYSYGWSFYFGAFSFIIAEVVGVVAVHIYIEKHQQLRARSHSELLKKSAFARLPPYRYRFRRRSSSRSTEPRSRDLSPVGKGFHAIPSTDISMFTLSRDPSKITMGTLLNSERDHTFLQFHNSTPKELKESLHNDPANRRTTPV